MYLYIYDIWYIIYICIYIYIWYMIYDIYIHIYISYINKKHDCGVDWNGTHPAVMDLFDRDNDRPFYRPYGMTMARFSWKRSRVSWSKSLRSFNVFQMYRYGFWTLEVIEVIVLSDIIVSSVDVQPSITSSFNCFILAAGRLIQSWEMPQANLDRLMRSVDHAEIGFAQK